ncbi:MAG: hypothetical protein HYY93_11075 [Planctomycetes bacterium]|nr:hypothetical protein [Planctomycetota bacterium]
MARDPRKGKSVSAPRGRLPEGAKACRGCGGAFTPRNRLQKFCTRTACFSERRAEYLKRYMDVWRRRHPDYWKTERQRQYLSSWRKTHPNYFKKWREKQKRLRRKH